MDIHPRITTAWFSNQAARYPSLCVNIHTKLELATINGATNLPLSSALPNPNHSPTKCISAIPKLHAAKS